MNLNSMVNVSLMGAGFFAIVLGLIWGAYLVLEHKQGRLSFKPFSIKANVVGNLPFALVVFGVAFIALGWFAS